VLLSMALLTHSESHPGSAKLNLRSWTSRPTTPLRPSSRSSLRGSLHSANNAENAFPLKRLEPAFAELSDAMADLEANMMHFQLIDESLARFGESFASFLYGLNMNAFCVDFPEVLLLLL
jgi:DASH complex subunit DAM1